jgi:sigma-70-like protein
MPHAAVNRSAVIGPLRGFVRASAPRLLWIARLLCNGDRAAAEDLVQDALVETFRRWSRIDRPDARFAYTPPNHDADGEAAMAVGDSTPRGHHPRPGAVVEPVRHGQGMVAAGGGRGRPPVWVPIGLLVLLGIVPGPARARDADEQLRSALAEATVWLTLAVTGDGDDDHRGTGDEGDPA